MRAGNHVGGGHLVEHPEIRGDAWIGQTVVIMRRHVVCLDFSPNGRVSFTMSNGLHTQWYALAQQHIDATIAWLANEVPT